MSVRLWATTLLWEEAFFFVFWYPKNPWLQTCGQTFFSFFVQEGELALRNMVSTGWLGKDTGGVFRDAVFASVRCGAIGRKERSFFFLRAFS